MSNMGSESFSAQTPIWPLVILRVGLGYWFLKAGYAKFPTMLESGKLASQLNAWAQKMPSDWYPWYKHILTYNIIPHTDLFVYLVVFGEIIVGIALIIGLMTRPALLAAIIMNINYHLASGYQQGAGGIINPIFICAEVTLIFTPVGRAFGIDYFMNKKYPRIPLW